MRLGVGDRDGDWLCDCVSDGVILCVTLGVPELVRDIVCVRLGELVLVSDEVAEPLLVSVGVMLPLRVDVPVPLRVRLCVSERD